MASEDYFALIEKAGAADSVESIHDLCCEVCQAYGFEYFLYAASIPTSFIKPQVIIIGGYPEEWREHYNEQGYQAIDPTILHCMTRMVPLTWDELERPARSDKGIRRFMGEARDFGLASGVSIPVHGTRGEAAMLSLASEDTFERSKSRIQHALPEVNLIAGHVHESVCRLVINQKFNLEEVKLTEREQECLLWATEGKTSWEISQILGVSERTVIFHLQNSADKLNVVNRQQAVARAVAMGLIRPKLS